MRMKSTFLPMIGVFAMTMMLAACDGSASTAGSSPTSTGYPAATATSAPATTSDLPLATASATVKGATKTILTTAGGLTVYYRTSDSGTNVFVGSAWPPVLAGSGAPTSSANLPGALAVLQDGNGAQVT
nr:hypothetical protein [Ktedonobacterales bacterium]